jgi:hypothetical protein
LSLWGRLSSKVSPKEAPQIERKLVGWWKLDETEGSTAADSSGNGHTGKLIGEPRWQPTGGKIGGALAFDGNDDYVNLGENADFDITNQITVAAWIKVNEFDKDWQAIITKGDSAWRLHRNGSTNNLEFACSGLEVPDNIQWGSIFGKTDINDGQWHHAVGVFDGSKLYLYVDGRLDVSSDAPGKINVNDQPVYIGENAEQPERFWNGLIDDVRIYNYALSEAEIAAIYSGKELPRPASVEKPGRGRNWIPVLIIVIIVFIAAGLTTRKKTEDRR